MGAVMSKSLRFILICTAVAVAQAPATEPPKPKPVVSMSELMLKVVYPYSDAIFYVEREAPENEVGWLALESKTLALAEIGNLLMSPVRAYDQERWMRDAQLLVDVATKAYKGAKARDLKSMIDLNAELYESCQSCHEHYRPGYRRRE
jgi:hypothetical protein